MNYKKLLSGSLILSVMTNVITPFVSTVSALTAPQSASTESIISIKADGIAPFDGTTKTPAGTDSVDNNGIVQNFDLIT